MHYTVDRVPPGSQWRHSTGFVDLEMCRTHLYAHAPGTLALACGPPPMLKRACQPSLTQMGFESGVSLIAL